MALWRILQTFVSLAIVNIAFAPAPYPRVHPEIGSFDEKLYWGTRAQGIATIRYTTRFAKWKRQPYVCHGVFVDLLKVVCPCSCLAYPFLGDSYASNPWFHQTDDSWTLAKNRTIPTGALCDQPFATNKGCRVERKKDHQHDCESQVDLDNSIELVEPRYLSVGVLTDEFLTYSGGRPMNKVGATLVQLAKDCSANYRSNYGIITLSATPKGAKLAWVYSADWLVMRWATNRAVLGAAAGAGRCEVMRWANHSRPLQEGSRAEVPRARFHDKPIRYDRDGNQRVLQNQAVQILPWVDCLEQICPQYAIPPYDKEAPMWDLDECYNNYNVTRFCVSWMQMDSLCLLPEGTPVFCDVGDLHGVFGLLVNHTIWCEESFNFRNVMVGMDTITNALYTIARIRNGPGYDTFGWPEYMDVQRTPNDYALQ